MSKRLTDTDKWKRAWFHDLDPRAKLVWLYLLDQCDHVGIWPVNFRLLSEQTGVRTTAELFHQWFGTKVVLFDGDKYFIPSFFKFQYSTAKEGFKAKISAMSVIESLGLTKYLNSSEQLPNSSEQLPNSSEQLPNCPSIGIGISKSISIGKGISNTEGGVGETKTQVSVSDIEAAYFRYPRKEGKTKGVEKALKEIKNRDDLKLFSDAVESYRAHCSKNKTEPKFIKHFATWVSEWRDWLDPTMGTAITTTKLYEAERDVDHDAEIAAIMASVE